MSRRKKEIQIPGKLSTDINDVNEKKDMIDQDEQKQKEMTETKNHIDSMNFEKLKIQDKPVLTEAGWLIP